MMTMMDATHGALFSLAAMMLAPTWYSGLFGKRSYIVVLSLLSLLYANPLL